MNIGLAGTREKLFALLIAGRNNLAFAATLHYNPKTDEVNGIRVAHDSGDTIDRMLAIGWTMPEIETALLEISLDSAVS